MPEFASTKPSFKKSRADRVGVGVTFARLIITALLIASVVAPVEAEQTIGDAIKKVFSTPTPTPARKKKKSASTKKERSSPSPSGSPRKSSSSPTASPPAKTRSSASPAAKSDETPSVGEKASPKSRKRKSKAQPEATETPTPASTPTPSPTETPTVAPESSPSASPQSRQRKNGGAPNATLSPDAVKGFEDNPPRVRKLLESALELTARNLDYQYGSADPGNGGMDCSGFVYYVLKQNGLGEVPRDSSQQYVWLRRAGKFEPVLSRKEDSFELENLKPGDLLFWTGTYSIERDPPITHAMIYVGREKKTGARVMVGSSDGRVYQGQSRNGVSVFDFRVERRENADDGKLRPTFIGYGHIPGLRE
jgi:cell wall-associated NlpC family hydrolase